MLRLRAFRVTSDKIVKIAVHPTHPWLVTADASDYVSVWNWEHRQIIYEFKAGGVDRKRLVGAKLEKLAEGDASKGKHAEAIRGGSVKHVAFFDDDVRYWQHWRRRSAAVETASAAYRLDSEFQASSIKGQHFLVICCENKAIFLDLVTMRGRDVPKQELDNKSLLCMEFLPWLSVGGGPLVVFGGSDGGIRILSMMTWRLAARCWGGHKGSVSCLMTFMASSGEVPSVIPVSMQHEIGISMEFLHDLFTFRDSYSELLVSGGSDGALMIWGEHQGHHGSLDLVAKQSMKAHDGGVVAIELYRVIGGSPHLITIGADKTLVIWDINKFKELRRIKPVPKLACHSVASWCHPRAPNLDILTCVKDSYIWAIEHPATSALTRPLCDLYSLIPPLIVATSKKLKVYCMVAHQLKPQLVATGTNVGVIVSEFDPGSLPPVTPLPMSAESRDHSAVCIIEKELSLLNFQLSNMTDPSLGNNSSLSNTVKLTGDSFEPLRVTQTKKRINAPVPHNAYSVLSVSGSGKYVAVVWPDILYFSIYKVSGWSIVDSGSAKLLAWDTCSDRFAILESTVPMRTPIIHKGSSSRKAKEAAAAAAAAQAAAAANSASANVQVRILLDDGTSNLLRRSIGTRSEPVTGLYGGALFGIAYRISRTVTSGSSTIHSMLSSGYGSSGSYDDGFSSQRSHAKAVPQNFQFFSWETFQPVGNLLTQPQWTAWDQTVEYCALAYQHYIVICTLRPQFRYLGDVAIAYATGAVWQRRQLFVATPTTIECVFVDAGVAPIDIETRKRKEEMKLKEAQARAVAAHGELALISVDGPQTAKDEKITLRPPMLQGVLCALPVNVAEALRHNINKQSGFSPSDKAPFVRHVVRLASFQHAPSVPAFLSSPKQLNVLGDVIEQKKVNEIAVGGGGVTVAVTRFPTEQKRPVGPLIVVGVRDGVLWLIDRYMTVHALSLSHPGIRCRCLAAYGDAVSAVKWAIWLAREHHDDLAQFLLGMGYATEALHLPGISKSLIDISSISSVFHVYRLEFDLAMKSNDLKRALQCLLKMSNSRDIGQDNPGLDMKDILNLTANKENLVESVQGIVKFAKEFMDLIDAADATAQVDIAREALKRLATAGSVKGALPSQDLRGLALRLANHGELTRLSGLANNLISLGLGREAAFAAALLGDNAHMEKAWQDTGMLAEAVLHAHV
ncbi:Transducin/WD40 repeat-like superfamily protein isoform 2 [Hibiscus syriacus]|uniref:Transducin/WD40 repeat-like superfamily protein isoform 2 n=1 Tax=Hibiscus syriacus TaxID=106335 RepID=A0A6A2ZYI7_HIBSY|nr:Transducin/WD40 repeat-like superfamily protein isoform 2 [Hibiscus syriacus]